MVIQLISAYFINIGQKKWTKSRKREKKNKKILKGPFSHNVQRIFFIFDSVNSYYNTVSKELHGPSMLGDKTNFG